MSDMTASVPQKKRPTSLTVMGILGIVFSSIGLLGVLASCAGTLCMQSTFGRLANMLPSDASEFLSEETTGMMETMQQLEQNLEIAENFVPMGDEERLAFFKDIVPLVLPKNLKWKADDWNNPTEWIPRRRELD